MRLSFKNISIRYKLLLIIIFITTVALIASFVFTLYFEKNHYLERVKNNTSTLAQIIAENNSAALIFNDTAASDMILETFNHDKSIKQVVLFDAKYNTFSMYSSDSALSLDKKMIMSLQPGETTISDENLNILVNVSDVDMPDEIIGHLYIQRSLKDLDIFIKQFMVYSALIFLLLLALTLVIGSFLQKIITKPIVKLSQLTNTITKTRNYKISLPYHAADETGKLVYGFNEMLKTIDVQNEELVAAREVAISNAKVKDEFLANMSNEIRTPLNVIVGLSNILIDTDLNEEQKKYLRNIKTASDNVLLIVNDILDYSKISTGKIEFERSEFPVIEVANEVIESHRPKAIEKHLEMKLFTGPSIPGTVIGDRLKLYQILHNLVSNSFKFTNQGYIHIFIELEKETSLVYNLVFRVRDTGIGIPYEKQNLVFESFRQGSPDTGRKYGGTGLGLAISRQLVEMQGGRISMESRPGQGTTFIFNLMYNKAVSSENKIRQSEMPVIEFEKLSKVKILIIEDNQLNVMVLQALLKKAGIFNIHTTGREDEAKEFLINKTFDIIMVDSEMENTEIIKLIRFIREELPGTKRNTPLLAVTEEISNEEQEKLISSGINDLITKPFNPSEIFGKLVKYVSNK